MADWMAYNTQSGEQVEIATQDLKAYIKNIPAKQAPYTHFWKAGWADWKPLTQIPEFMKLRQTAAPPPPPRAKAPPPPAPSLSVVKQMPADDEDEDEIPENEPTVIDFPVAKKKSAAAKKSSGGRGAERRMSERYRVKLKVLITVDNLVFRTFTVDASKDGVRLEHALPEALVGNDVEIYFSSPNAKSGLRFTATLVADQHEMTRFQFSNPNEQTQKVFESWLKTIPGLAAKAA